MNADSGKFYCSKYRSTTQRLLQGLGLIALLTTSSVALAQDPDDAQDQDQESANPVLEEVTITGSRIARTGMNTPTPVTMVDAQELSYMAPGDMIDAVSTLPQFFANQTPNSPDGWFVRGGYGMLNLRGLGINRTLTLLDGRRMTSSTAFGGVDINVIPEAVVKRVETVTGGASAAYGTDAVAGVVNFILDTEFEGLDAHAQAGSTDRSDADNWEASVTFGTAIGDRGHLIASIEKSTTDEITSFEGRNWYQAWGTVPDANGMLQVLPNVVSMNATFDGLIFAPGSSLNGLEFHPDGSTSPFATNSTAFLAPGIPPARQSIAGGGSGQYLGYYSPYIWPELNRESAFLHVDWDFTDNFNVFAEYIYGENETSRFNTPGGSFHGTPTAITIFQDNAFLPDDIRQTMIDEGLQSFTFKRMGGPLDTLGQSRIWDKNEMNSFTVGFHANIDNGGFFDGWQVNGYYQQGRNKRKWYQHGLRVDRIHAAVDAVVDPDTGDIVCRVSLYTDMYPGCVPLDLFGAGNASAAAIDYVMGFEPGQTITTPLYFADTGFDLGLSTTYVTGTAKVNNTDFDQDIFELSASGPISEGWGAGPIDLALGYSYRKEDILQIVHDVTNPASDFSGNFHPVPCDDPSIGLRGVSVPDCLNTVGVQYSKVSNIMGHSDVSEFFGESNIPLVAGKKGMSQMTANLAARWADYSGSGSIWAYKAGLDMQFTSDFRVRATYSRDVRAANMSERFDKTGGSAVIMDPEFGGEVYNVTRYSGGNPAVKPEKADTYTLGFVWQPSGVEGLQMSLDWYQIDIKDAIGQLGVQGVVNQCYAGAAAACELVTRNPDDNRIILVGDVYINIAESIAKGADFEVAYSKAVDWFGGGDELLSARLFVSWLDERSEQQAGAAKIDRAGQTGIQQSDGVPYALPDYKLTAFVNYTNGPWATFLQGRYIASGTSENSLVEGKDISDNSVDSAFYLDWNLGYTFQFSNGTTLELFGNVTNLLDEDPPITPYYSVFLGYAQQTNSLLFDTLGRRYTVGARVRFF